MTIFTKPENLNGSELIKELAEVGIIVNKIFDNADGTISIDTDDESKVASVVAVHNGTTIAPNPTIEQKLASVGLNVDDLKLVLGI